jgi:hypothetical protein
VATAGKPSDEDNFNAGVDFDAGGTTKDSSQLGTSIKRQGGHALAGGQDRNNAAEDSAESSLDSASNEGSKLAKETCGHADGDIGLESERKPEQNNSLELSAERAARAGEPSDESGTNFNIKGDGGTALGASLEGGLNVGIKTDGNVGFEEGGERSLGAGGEDASLLDKGDDGSTGGDRCQTTAGQRANGNDVGASLTLQPSQNGNLQRSGQGAFGTGEPGLQGGLNIGGEVDEDTAASTKAETSPNLGIESSINRRREECGQRSLGRSAQDNIGGNLGGGEDTLKGNKEVALGGDVSASGDQH